MKPLHIPLIRSLDLTFPDKYFALLPSDPCDTYRALNRVNRRLAKSHCPPVTSLLALGQRKAFLKRLHGIKEE